MGDTPLPTRLERLALGLLAAALLGAALFFYTEARDQFELPKQLLLRALSSGLLGLLLAGRLADPSLGWRRGPLDWPVLAWCAWLLVGTVLSVAPWVSWRGEYENFAGSLTQLNYAALYFAAVQLLRTPADARFLLRSVLVAALGAAFYALLQASQRDLVAWASTSIVADRFFGPLGNPNFLGGLMAMAIPLHLALAYEGWSGAKSSDPARFGRWGLLAFWFAAYLLAGKAGLLQFWQPRPGSHGSSQALLLLWLLALPTAAALRSSGRQRAAYALGQISDLLLLFQALANTGTRGAFLGLLIGLGVLALAWRGAHGGGMRAFFAPRSLAVLGLLGLLLGMAIMGLGTSFRARVLDSLRNPTRALETSRWQIWVPALHIWQAHPVMGTGVDSFKTVFPRYSQSRFARYDGENVSSRLAHCEPLHIAATQGSVGLAIWLWLCGAFFWAWWRRVRDEGAQQAWWLGLGALAAAYLGQNLVSFGVAGISAPFWALLALPGLGQDRRLALPWRPWPKTSAWLVGALLFAAGLWAVSLTVRADLRYAFSSQAQDQLAALERAPHEELVGVAGWAFHELGKDLDSLDTDESAELDHWRQVLTQAEQRRLQDPAALAQLAPIYQRAGGSLLMLLAAQAMQQATTLCPQEVKYEVYLGLAYEELFRRATPERQERWFRRAEAAYRRSTQLNPGNAYYRGNLGRLFGMGAEAGHQPFFKEAEARYLEALERAPVTRLFYENLLLLYARYAAIEQASAVLDTVEARDKELAPQLLIAAASTFFQWRDSGQSAWTPERRKAAAEAAMAWGLRAQALRPGDGDQVTALAIFAQALGRDAEARRWAAEALRLKPQDRGMEALLKQRGLLR